MLVGALAYSGRWRGLLAESKGSVVTAEGVETEEQPDAVQTLGCDRAQGFLLARPMPIEELTAMLTA